ncbi:MAG: hypothetical protein AVDCRST_MAG27-773, partial [uncultured Craurococcus sp.]
AAADHRGRARGAARARRPLPQPGAAGGHPPGAAGPCRDAGADPHAAARGGGRAGDDLRGGGGPM